MKAFRKKYHQVIQTRTGNTAPLLLTSVKKNKRKVGHGVAEWVPRGGVDPGCRSSRFSGSRASAPAAGAEAGASEALRAPQPTLFSSLSL